jgi:hypothetical protein
LPFGADAAHQAILRWSLRPTRRSLGYFSCHRRSQGPPDPYKHPRRRAGRKAIAIPPGSRHRLCAAVVARSPSITLRRGPLVCCPGNNMMRAAWGLVRTASQRLLCVIRQPLTANKRTGISQFYRPFRLKTFSGFAASLPLADLYVRSRVCADGLSHSCQIPLPLCIKRVSFRGEI